MAECGQCQWCHPLGDTCPHEYACCRNCVTCRDIETVPAVVMPGPAPTNLVKAADLAYKMAVSEAMLLREGERREVYKRPFDAVMNALHPSPAGHGKSCWLCGCDRGGPVTSLDCDGECSCHDFEER